MSCEILHSAVWGASVNSLALIFKTIYLFLLCKLIFWKATKVGSPPNFSKLISQLWGIPQPQYSITLLLDPHWTYFWKHYIYYKKDTKVGSQNFGYQIWFCTRLLSLLHLTLGLHKLRKDNCKPRWETLKVWGFGATYTREFTVIK